MKFVTKIAVVALTGLSLVGGTSTAFAAVDADANGTRALVTTPATDGQAGVQAKLKAKRFAVVESNGVLARGKNAVTANQVSGGTYEVFFDRDVTGCLYIATIGTTSIGTEAAGAITVASRAGEPNGVWVDTSNLDGTDGTRAFHLEVVC